MRILWLLQSTYPDWVPATALCRISLQYNARIFGLRRKGWQIANRVEIQSDGTKHGSFRLAAPGTQPNPPKAATRTHSENIDGNQSVTDFTSSLFGDLAPTHKDLG